MTQSNDYTVYYWAFHGRGNFPRILLEQAGVKYNDIGNPEEFNGMLYGKGIPKDKKETPVFAPPLLRHGNLLLSQTPVMCKYLADVK